MKKLKGIAVLLCVFSASVVCAQGEEVGPITGNPILQQKAMRSAKLSKANPGTFDSTFIYTPDTISLPVFDEFSTNKFQTYNADYNDVGVTFDKVYRLLDNSDVPIPNGTEYTGQQTFKRTYVVQTSSFSDSNFNPITVKIGSLASYPVTHVPTDAYPPYHVYDTVDMVGGTDPSPDTIWITGPDIFQDSATQFFAPVNDPSLIWIESEAFHNYTFAVNPWTLGVATFDGLDEKGYPYDIGSTTTNFADHLTSKPIDMSGVNAGDSVYLSFLYQAEGFGDIPELGDSLILEFYAPELLQWNKVWSAGGEGVSDFKVGHIRIENADYFKKGFQFRFVNFGGLSGSLDHFHLDYVNLRTLSGYQDTLFKDFSISYPVTTLIRDYTSVPWDHWKNNFTGKMSDNVEIIVRNGSNIAENNQDGSTEVFYNSASEGTFTLVGQTLSGGNINYGPRTTYYSYHDFSTGYHFDETKPGDKQVFDIVTTASAQFPNFPGNDSTFSQQVFENYYAYDDGSAEQAYGPTGPQAMLAVGYTPYEADTLLGVNIHWVPSVTDVSDNLFFLTVWDDNNGQPGAILYQDSPFFPSQPRYEFDRNLFSTYMLRDTVLPINGTFYVGWRQVEAERMNIGLDRNIATNNHTYFSLNQGATWNQSNISGSVMIRPIFSTALDATLGIEPIIKEAAEVKVYPNPSNSIVNIEVENGLYQGVEVVDIQGRLVIETNESSVNLQDRPDGVYFFRMKGLNQTVKVIKR